MHNLLKKGTHYAAPTSRVAAFSMLHTVLYYLSWFISILAFVSAVLLLTTDMMPTSFPHAPLSAAPLILIGAAYLMFQGWIKPNLLDLCKALIVCTAFILWGIDQMLPAGWLAMTLGDIVITLYVLDLGWNVMERLQQKHEKL